MKKFLLIISMALLGISASAELQIVQKKNKYGFADETGKVVIKQQYDQVFPFENGMAKVQKGKKWGYIDTQGKPVIKIEYDFITELDDSNLLRVKKSNKWGYLRKDGSVLIKPEFTFIGTPNEQGYVWVSKGKTLDAGAIGLYKDGVMIVKPQYRYLGFYQKTDSADYSDGHVFTTAAANEITENFTKLSTSDVPYIWYDRAFNRGMLDLNGKVIIKEIAYAQGAPSDNLVSIRQYNRKKSTYAYNYMPIDGSNKKLFKKDIVLGTEQPELCHPFKEGSALIVTKNSGCYLIDKTGATKSQKYASALPIGNNMFIVKSGNLMGVINDRGTEIVDCKYSDLRKPVEGRYMSACDASTSKYGIIDDSGAVIVPFAYEDAAGIIQNKVYLKDSFGWGVFDMNLKPIIAPRWDDISFAFNPTDKVVWVKNSFDGKWHTLSFETDKYMYNLAFDEITAFNKDGISVVRDGNKYGAVHNTGYVVIPAMISSPLLIKTALAQLKSSGKDKMSEADTYRFNIYQNPERHKYRLHQTVSAEMWDY